MTELEARQEMTRTEVADYLREFAAQLDTSSAAAGSRPHQPGEDDDGRVTFMVGNDSATINPPETIMFEVEVESDSPILGGEEQEVEFELTWQAEASSDTDDEEELEIK